MRSHTGDRRRGRQEGEGKEDAHGLRGGAFASGDKEARRLHPLDLVPLDGDEHVVRVHAYAHEGKVALELLEEGLDEALADVLGDSGDSTTRSTPADGPPLGLNPGNFGAVP